MRRSSALSVAINASRCDGDGGVKSKVRFIVTSEGMDAVEGANTVVDTLYQVAFLCMGEDVVDVSDDVLYLCARGSASALIKELALL